jgi:hypothetical protein
MPVALAVAILDEAKTLGVRGLPPDRSPRQRPAFEASVAPHFVFILLLFAPFVGNLLHLV